MFAESLALLEEVRSGARLPQTSSEQNRSPDTHGVRRGGRGWGRGEKDGEKERRRRRRGERRWGGERRRETHTAAVTCRLLSYCRVPSSLATASPCMTPGTSR